MRQKVAKSIRRKVYGDAPSNRAGRRYFMVKTTGQVVADDTRRLYQQAKNRYKTINGEGVQV